MNNTNYLHEYKQIPEDEKKAADELVAEFNFQRVSEIMAMLDWKWAGYDRTPSVSDLAQTAISLLSHALRNGLSSCSSGGLRAVVYEEELQLEFVAETFSVEL